jgi:hypothetical protein
MEIGLKLHLHFIIPNINLTQYGSFPRGKGLENYKGWVVIYEHVKTRKAKLLMSKGSLH